MNIEVPQQRVTNPEDEVKARAFDGLFDKTISGKSGEGVPRFQYELPYPKEDFLRHLSEGRNMLLHGSPNDNLEMLEPRQANDTAKQSGNKNAVYAVTNPVLPIFYAIQDKTKISGLIQSGVERDGSGDELYEFVLPKTSEGKIPWKRGAVYVFDREPFHPEKDDDGNESNEWTSEVPVRPVAVLDVGPEDFRFLDEVRYET